MQSRLCRGKTANLGSSPFELVSLFRFCPFFLFPHNQVFAFVFTVMNDVLSRFEHQQSTKPASGHVTTTDTSGDESGGNQRARPRKPKKKFVLKRSYATDELGSLFVTGASDCSKHPGSFRCRICRRDISLETKGRYEILRHFQGSKHFVRDQRLRLETPGMRVLDRRGRPLADEELDRQRESILRGLLVKLDKEYPFPEDLIVGDDGAVDPQLPITAKVASLVSVLLHGGPYELVESLWGQFASTAARANFNVSWSLR